MRKMYVRIELEDLLKTEGENKEFEVEAVPIYINEQNTFLKSLFGPKWIGVIQQDENRIIAKRARFGSSFFHTDKDLAMLLYATEQKIPVTFRGQVFIESRGGGLSENSSVPVLRVDDYYISDGYSTYGFGR